MTVCEAPYSLAISCSYPARAIAAATASSPTNASRCQQDSSTALPPNPWSFGFQCNERYLDWDTSAQIALIKIWLAEKMEITVPEVSCYCH